MTIDDDRQLHRPAAPRTVAEQLAAAFERVAVVLSIEERGRDPDSGDPATWERRVEELVALATAPFFAGSPRTEPTDD